MEVHITRTSSSAVWIETVIYLCFLFADVIEVVAKRKTSTNIFFAVTNNFKTTKMYTFSFFFYDYKMRKKAKEKMIL